MFMARNVYHHSIKARNLILDRALLVAVVAQPGSNSIPVHQASEWARDPLPAWHLSMTADLLLAIMHNTIQTFI